ncbi:MAG: endo alpha-1,4 polygalactosaminidase [Collimonas sp.]
MSDTWQWQLRGSINMAYVVNVYDIDLFDAPQLTINSLKARGIRVVCYFSAGSSENWRPDFNRFLASDMGNDLIGWAGERWLDTRSANVRGIMTSRLDMAVAKGCDGVEPDNVDGYANNPGFPLTDVTQLDFNGFLATEAHARGLAIGLKNDMAQIGNLVSSFDFAVNEECFQKNECGGYSAFASQSKPVFNAEYAQQYQTNSGGARDALCAASKAAKIHTLVLPLALDDSFRFSCD